MISYAQNFEDIILHRALKDVDSGFYIDIGAQHPVIDSVSLSFYEAGWRGVHVEPIPEYAELLRRSRQGEDVLQVAVGVTKSAGKFYDFPATGLSTGIKSIADGHIADGRKANELKVDFRPLSSILDDYKDRQIHWLKIDCEGMESEIISSWNPSKVRPWIVVVEATVPLTNTKNHRKWEPALLSLGYVFAYDDGLNRFYASVEKKHLAPVIATPPNYFDDFSISAITAGFRILDRELVQRKNYLSALNERINQGENALEDAERARFETLVSKVENVDANLAIISADKRAMTKMIDRMTSAFERRAGVAESALAEERSRNVLNERLAADAERRVVEQAAVIETISSDLGASRQEARILEQALHQRQAELSIIKKDALWRAIQPLRRMRKSIARMRRGLLNASPKTLPDAQNVQAAQVPESSPTPSAIAAHKFMSTPVGPRPLLLNRADQIFDELKAERRSLVEVKY